MLHEGRLSGLLQPKVALRVPFDPSSGQLAALISHEARVSVYRRWGVAARCGVWNFSHSHALRHDDS
jgi:hypothetical protein